jgi:hypothetical protein
MLIRVAAVALLILATMIAVKDGRVLRAAGLTGSCSVAAARGDGTQLESCKSGRLEGRPDLGKDGCTSAGFVGALEYWRCPASVEASAGGR